jgi:hypothetical protein
MKTKPQEKAKDLVSKFGHDLALKVVTEITIAMETYDDRNDTFELQNMEGDFRYWDQVNIELQHLRQQQEKQKTPRIPEIDYAKAGTYTFTAHDAIRNAKTVLEVNYLYQHDKGFFGFKKELTEKEQALLGTTLIWTRSGLQAEQKTLEQRIATLEQKVEQISQPKKFAQGSTFDRQKEIKRLMEEWNKSAKNLVPFGLTFELVGEDIKNSSEQEKSSSERDFVEFDPKDYSFEKELAALDEMHKKLLVDFACEAYDIKYRSDDSFRNVATELYNKIYNSKTNESNTRHQ